MKSIQSMDFQTKARQEQPTMGHDVKAENACDRRVELICSDDFDNALKSGSERCIEIEGTIKERDKANYATFYDIMLRGNPEMESISDKRKSTRTPQEEEAFNAFRKRVRSQYRMVRDFIWCFSCKTCFN